MNGRLILQLSMLGLAMGLGTVFFIPSNIEPAFWLAIFLFDAYLIARGCASKRFLNGFLLGLANCVWVTSAHVLLASTYLASHVREAEMMKQMPVALAPQLVMLITSPIVGVISGTLIGLLALAAGALFRPKSIATAA